jgi:hypothetical protein
MANRSSLNAKNLEALGAARLAELLLAHTEGDAAARRALRLELAQQEGPLEIARAVRKRLATIARSRTWLEADREAQLVSELDRQRQAIVGPIAAHDADLAVELLWRFLDLSESFLRRCDDADATALALFHQATADLGRVATRSERPVEVLVEDVAAALPRNGDGQFDHLIADLKEALQPEGLRGLRERMEALRPADDLDDEDAPAEDPFEDDDFLGDWDGEVDWTGDPIGTVEDNDPSDPVWLSEVVQEAMLAIADALGDAEAYLAEYRDHDPSALATPAIAAAVANRLCAAGQAAEALALLEAADLRWGVERSEVDPFVDAHLRALDALGRGEEAQALRWEHGLGALSIPHLREHLRRLPAFEDGEAEERALDLVLRHPDFGSAVQFLHQWPDRRRAARLILERREDLDGEPPEALEPLAEALEREHPLAATLCLRALIENCLEGTRPGRQRTAARQLSTCARLADTISDWHAIPDHPAYCRGLLQAYSHRTGFWRLLPPPERGALLALPGLPLWVREVLE